MELHNQLLTFLNKDELRFAEFLGISGWNSIAMDEHSTYRCLAVILPVRHAFSEGIAVHTLSDSVADLLQR